MLQEPSIGCELFNGLKNPIPRPSNFVAKGFCKNALAKNKQGISVSEGSEDAIMWCQAGARWKIFGSLIKSPWPHTNDPARKMDREYGFRLQNLVGMDDVDWNNGVHTIQEQVVAAMREVENIMGKDPDKDIIWETELLPCSGINDVKAT